MAIEEVVDWDTEARDNQAVHPTSREGERAVRISRSIQEIQAAIARWRDTLGSGTLGGLTDVTLTNPQLNEVLTYNGSIWVNQAVSGGASIPGTWQFDDTVSPADPGSGNFRLNNNTIASATALYIADESKGGTDFSVILNSLNAGDRIYLQNAEDATESLLLTITAVTDETGWFRITFTVDDTGTATTWTDGKEFAYILSLGGSGGGSLPAGTVTNSAVRWNGSAWVEEPDFQINSNGNIESFGVQNDVLLSNNIANTMLIQYPVPATEGEIRTAVGSSNGHSIFSGNNFRIRDAQNADNMLVYTKNGGWDIYYNDVNVARTRPAANGGLEVNNTATGAGFERVLTTSDSAGGGIGGSIADNQVAVGAATANEIEGSSSLEWDGTELDVGGAIGFTAGSTVGAGLHFNNDPDCGIYRPSNNQMAFDAGGFQFMIGSSNQVILAHSSGNALRTIAPASGGVQVFNQLTGAGFERALTESDLGELVVKASDETVTNSTTLQDDDDLQVTLDANGTYEIEVFLMATSASATPDIKVLYVEPDGTWELLANEKTDTGNFTAGLDESSAARVLAIAANGISTQHARIVAKAGGTGGTFKLQWAQNTVDAVNGTTVQKGSWMRARKLLDS